MRNFNIYEEEEPTKKEAKKAVKDVKGTAVEGETKKQTIEFEQGLAKKTPKKKYFGGATRPEDVDTKAAIKSQSDSIKAAGQAALKKAKEKRDAEDKAAQQAEAYRALGHRLDEFLPVIAAGIGRGAAMAGKGLAKGGVALAKKAAPIVAKGAKAGVKAGGKLAVRGAKAGVKAGGRMAVRGAKAMGREAVGAVQGAAAEFAEKRAAKKAAAQGLPQEKEEPQLAHTEYNNAYVASLMEAEKEKKTKVKPVPPQTKEQLEKTYKAQQNVRINAPNTERGRDGPTMTGHTSY